MLVATAVEASGGPRDVAAERVTKEVDPSAEHGHGRKNIAAKLLERVRRRVVGPGRLVLTALVDRDHPTPAGGQRLEHRRENPPCSR